MSLVMQICKHCGWEMRCGDVLIIKKDNVLTCPSCKRPIEFVEKVAEPLPKDKASVDINYTIDTLCWCMKHNKPYCDIYEEGFLTIKRELKAKDEEIERLNKQLSDQEYNDDLSADRVKSLEMEIEGLGLEAHIFYERLGEFDKYIERIEERNEKLEDLVIKWESSYTKLRRKIDDLL